MAKLESTKALRPVSKDVDAVVGDLPNGAFNFGLYFQKWFYVVDWRTPQSGIKADKGWSCLLADESTLVEKKINCREPSICLDNLALSLALFNEDKSYRRDSPERQLNEKFKVVAKDRPVACSWRRNESGTLLSEKHASLDRCANAFEMLGFTYTKYVATLKSSLIIGLGNEHPTEKGFRFDWTLGIPMIPSSSLKGVVRLAFLVNLLNQMEDFEEAERVFKNIEKDDGLPAEVKDVFGYAGERKAASGKVIFLDAYPEKLPKLKAEIMNCHYEDYLQKGTRGPTEDQNPNPQKFWAIDPLLDATGARVRFVFRVLLHPEIAHETTLVEALEKAFVAALAEHGLGAKTAIGHGRMHAEPSEGSPDERPVAVDDTSAIPEATKAEEAVPTETWEGANVHWDQGKKEISAVYGDKKTVPRPASILPDELRKKLKKKKRLRANVTVLVKGDQYFEIIAVD